ncbi:glycosyltransferase family 4 protein [Candidatus Woesearchaeota archaeon]|nr:glycosyltransferase family 4 protein [Candidatus Woesearchaeota archaeon]
MFYKPAGGGIPRYVDDLARSLSKLKNDVDIITVSYDEKEKVVSDEKITVYYTASLNIFGKSHNECIRKSRAFMKFLRKYVDNQKPDIFVTQNLHAAISSISHTLVLNMISLEKKIPIILTIHSFPEEPFSQLKIALAKNLFWDKIIAVSSSVAEVFYKEGISIEKIKVFNPGVDINTFKPRLGKKWLKSRVEGLNEKDLIILHASRTDSIETIEEKGIKDLLKAFSFLYDRFNNVKLLIASAPVAPPFEESKEEAIGYIMNLGKLYGLGNKIKIVTFQPEEMPLVYNGSDIFVLASYTEGCPMVVQEAIACGLPVIGTSVGGIPDIIVNGKCGYIIHPNNPVELSKYLSLLIEDPKKRKSFGSYGRKRALSKFNINKIAKKRIGNYESILHERIKKSGLGLFRQIANE